MGLHAHRANENLALAGVDTHNENRYDLTL
jgi:hypothetical protein